MRFLYELALRLNLSVTELKQLPASELTGWVAYFNLQNQPAEPTADQQYAQMRQVLG